MVSADAPQAIALGDQASAVSRFLAASVDFGLILVFALGSNRFLDLDALTLPMFGSFSLASLIGVLLPAFCLALMAKFLGVSPGKRVLGLRIVHAKTRDQIAYWQAAVRQALWLVSLFAGWVFLWIFCDRRGQGLHDKLARTLVVRAS